MNEPALPSVKMAPPALVMDGASLTVSVNECVASGETPLLAVIVKL